MKVGKLEFITEFVVPTRQITETLIKKLPVRLYIISVTGVHRHEKHKYGKFNTFLVSYNRI